MAWLAAARFQKQQEVDFCRPKGERALAEVTAVDLVLVLVAVVIVAVIVVVAVAAVVVAVVRATQVWRSR